MADPQTVNVGLSVPLLGSNVGTWNVPVNGDFVAIDGLIAGVTTIGLGSTNVTLTAPAGFVPTPGAGPTQAQNSVLRFTGLLTANVTVTLPLPGRYLVENLTTGNFTVQLFGNAGGQRVSTAQGSRVLIYNDGVNCYFINDSGSSPGKMELWAGITAMPSWVGFCTTPPYVVCDGSIYNFVTFPFLGAKLGATFGGNGVTTFGVPDMRGRVPLAYDGTGARITVGGCGINGQVLGSSLNTQTNTIIVSNLPAYTPAGSVSVTSTVSTIGLFNGGLGGFATPGPGAALTAGIGTSASATSVTSTGGLAGNAQGGASQPMNNVQPSQVVGIWVIHT